MILVAEIESDGHVRNKSLAFDLNDGLIFILVTSTYICLRRDPR